jgi:hypothetical protein
MTSLSGDSTEEQWLDDEAGRIVRPYVMTRGRTRPSRGKIDLITLVVTTNAAGAVDPGAGPEPASEDPGLGPEHLAIVRLCQRRLPVAEIAARLDLPVGTVRVLLGDLADGGFVALQQPAREVDLFCPKTYEAVLDGLRAL